MTMDKTYNHIDHEAKIYALWEKSGAFTPKLNPKKKRFTIVMPPPNANDPLHVGHAMFVTIEDILIRYHRMKGDVTLWLPGTDHAGIETQYVFEKKLAKKGKSRFDFDRATLYKMIWDYVQENSGVAIDQMKRLGASADWTRFKFTLDPDIVDFVLDTFIELHQKGQIYRGERLVNYCIKCGTGYSELEVEYVERKDPLYYIKYPLADNPKKHLTVATTRPEPIWVDTHLAVNPKDKKNKILIGKKVLNPLTSKEMVIIADTFVDPEFGTGLVKLTPAHDAVDYETAQKHSLPIISAINTDGKMLGGPSKGKKVSVAREEALEYLKEKGFIQKIDEDYNHRIGTCYRCHSIIEPLPLPQFFLKVNNLAKKSLDSLKKKDTIIVGKGWDKVLKHWLANIKDWNISRQIVWGIKIPIWYNVSGYESQVFVGILGKSGKQEKGTIQELEEKGYTFNNIKTNLQQITIPIDQNKGNVVPYIAQKNHPKEKGKWLPETDTFDTWFSSGQWPVVTLKTTNKGDFDFFYPTTVMETAYDILTRWVMRMMFMGIYLTGKPPFKWVFLHGLIRDEQGRKMSKSIGNVVNPLVMVDKYGADALRFALVMSSVAGQDKAVGENTIRGMRNFSNKIWNAGRYIKLNYAKPKEDVLGYSTQDQIFYKTIKQIVNKITQQLDDYKIGLAAETVYNYFWHWFCDDCIEKAKKGELSWKALIRGYDTFLQLLHPFLPFVTEAVWQELADMRLKKDPLIISSWPVASKEK